jgi:hypothetical protein
MKRLLGPLFTATLLIPTAVHAGTVFDKYFAGAEGGKTCYTRLYDEQHLKIHPRQRVTQIVLAFDIAKSGSSKPLDGHKFEVALGLRVKDASELFLSPAYCSIERSGAVCHVEGDGGTFWIGPGSNDGSTIEVTSEGLRFEGENDAIEVGGKRSDDKRFRLSRIDPARCSIRLRRG